MKNFCKKNIWIFSVLFLSALLSGCGVESEDSVPVLIPDNGMYFWIYPNDEARRDSASANLSHGLLLSVHPNGVYRMSFDADLEAGEPRLLLYRVKFEKDAGMARFYRTRVLEPELENNRYVYNFICEEKEAAEWAAVLEKDGTYYQGSTNNLKFTATGAYSDHLSLNLVVTGNVVKKLNGFTVDELAQEILKGFRKYYTSISVDTIFVSYAHEHPVYGGHYPSNEPWIAGRSDSDLMMQSLGGGWPGRNNALDLVLVHYIDEVGLMGYSYVFSGNLGAGSGSTVVLGAFVKTATSQIALSKSAIAETAVHESGHFFGLRHTTSTTADLDALGDYSSVEDGLEDTPYCEDLLKSGLLKEKGDFGHGTDYGIPYGWNRHGFSNPLGRSDFKMTDCPDARNMMFPAETDMELEGLSKQQLEIVRSNLMIFPH